MRLSAVNWEFHADKLVVSWHETPRFTAANYGAGKLLLIRYIGFHLQQCRTYEIF
jgi:hypothetical protein